MRIDEPKTSEGNQIPATKSVASEFFEAPTRFLVMSFNPIVQTLLEHYET